MKEFNIVYYRTDSYLIKIKAETLDEAIDKAEDMECEDILMLDENIVKQLTGDSQFWEAL